MKPLHALALLACACDARDQPPIVGTPPIECFPPVAGEKDDVGSGNEPAPLAWLIAPLPTRLPDCAGPAPVSDVRMSVPWRDRGTVSMDPIAMRVTTSIGRAGDRCKLRITTEVFDGPARKPGSIEPCQVVITSDAWASLQTAKLTLDALAIDGDRREVAWTIAWVETTDDITECRAAERIDRDSLGLVIVSEVSLPLADWRRMSGLYGPTLALGVRIDAR